jgi:two-component system phosphate regulon sensor histidine kinase PhoR
VARLTALDRARADFIHTISHELRTPLTSIRAGLGFLEVAIGPRLGPDERDLFDAIRRNTERLRLQIADLLAANQLEAGALRPERTRVDLRRLVADATAELGPLLQEKGQVVALDLPAPLPVVGDRRLLEQVVLNLLANAGRHTPPGTHITVTGRVAEDETQLSVSDSGPGLAPAEVEAIFAPFYSAGAAAGGAGLGLAIARRIAALHGGRLWTRNADGAGGAPSSTSSCRAGQRTRTQARSRATSGATGQGPAR